MNCSPHGSSPRFDRAYGAFSPNPHEGRHLAPDLWPHRGNEWPGDALEEAATLIEFDPLRLKRASKLYLGLSSPAVLQRLGLTRIGQYQTSAEVFRLPMTFCAILI